jgi:5'-nucleotidase
MPKYIVESNQRWSMKYINTNKLEQLKINKNNVYIVIDFDKTITSKNSSDSWDVSGKLLGEDFKKELNTLYEKYRPIELDNNISIKEKETAMVEWYEKCMYLYYKYHLTQEKLKESVEKSNLVYRKGAKEFLQKAHQEEIPIIILSAGIGNVIEQFLKETNCYFENIYIIANFMEFDEKGKVKKFDNSKIIHTLNKTMKGKLQKDCNEKIKNRAYKILIGDLKEDENMVEKEEWDTTLKIGILEYNVEKRLELYQNTFDIVLTDDDATFDLFNNFIHIFW